MSSLRDYRGVNIRLSDERLAHMLDVHPEIAANEHFIAETVGAPEIVVQSRSDARARLYYRGYRLDDLGEKRLCVLVLMADDPFVLTAYFTDRIKKGEILWRRE